MRGKVVLRAQPDKTGVTRIAGLRQQGSLKLVFPKLFRPDLEAVLVNTGGGVTGGDRLDVDLGASDGATVTLTTQAAERFYRAQPGERGRIANRIHVAAGARLNWLPQETILFERAACQRKLAVDLEHDATFLMVETLIMGRAAMGETLHDVDFEDRIRINRDGRPIYLDGIDLKGDVAAQMARPALGASAGAVCTLVLVQAGAAARLSGVRALLRQHTGGASLLAEDVLVLRLVAADSFVLRQTLVPVLGLLNDTPLPRSWRL